MDDIGWSLVGFKGKAQLEVSAEICNLLEQILRNKTHRMRSVRRPKILLLYDLYHSAPVEAHQACKPRLSELLSSFHTVFVVKSESEGFVLYSENKDWLAGAK